MDMKKTVFVFVILLLFSVSALADYSGDMTSGNSAYKAGDFKAAYGYYLSAYNGL